jgi:ATP-binding cassette subfamily C protein CydC/ATP-binding cassette subfamily C protein CydCD
VSALGAERPASASPSASPSAWRSLLRAARLRGREGRQLALSILLAFGTVLAATGLLTTSGYLISRAAQRPDILSLTAVIVAVRGFGIARAALRYSERLVSHELALRVLARLRASFYEVLAPLGPGALGGHRRGELLARFIADVDALQDLYLRALGPPIVALMVIASAALTAWLMLPVAALAIGACLLVAAVAVPALTAALAAAAGRRQAPARAALTSELVEALDGSVELAVAGRGADRVARLGALGRELAKISRRDALAGATSSMLMSLLSGLTIVAALLVAIPAVHSGALSGVLLAAVVFLVLGAFEGITPLPAAAKSLRGCAESARRLAELAGTRPAVLDPPRPRALARRSAGPLALEGVRFRYGAGDVDAPGSGGGGWVLDGLDLRLLPGSRIALAGPSGIGKTTLAHLLVRFLDPLDGRVTLDGIDLRELAQHDVRGAVVLAAQDSHVFTTTIRENLLLANRRATETEIWSALAATQLETWIRSLPEGLDTLVGEDGDLVSGGQRQRIALTRALLADARYLVLDEPTAHLDATTARDVMRCISAAAGERGLLVISHREEGFEGFERFTLSGGRAVAQSVPVCAHE